jgi:hypothetical protein
MHEFELNFRVMRRWPSFLPNPDELDDWVGHPDNPVGSAAVDSAAMRRSMRALTTAAHQQLRGRPRDHVVYDDANWVNPEAAQAASGDEPCLGDPSCCCPECVCCCGESMHAHSVWDNHVPRAMADYARQQLQEQRARVLSAAAQNPGDIYDRIDLLAEQIRASERESAVPHNEDRDDLKHLITRALLEREPDSERVDRMSEAIFTRLLSSS